jgi:glycine hydroxymethyltransferase
MPKLKLTDKKVAEIIKNEEKRQSDQLEMIPSENYASDAVREAVGSVFMNKYSEGYPHRRYYQGNEFADKVEILAEERAKKLFGVPYVNVQPYSGSPANSAVYFALLEPGDLIMGLELASGGHLTHGHPKVTFSGKYFKTVQYGLGKNGFLDYEQIEKLAAQYRPKIIVSGLTAYPRNIDFKKFGEVADKVGAYHLADISHISGLVAGGALPSPVKYADIVMTTTHKSLRGPRGAMLMVTDKGLKKDPELGVKIDKAVFPGLQGGPHDNVTAGIAVCLAEADTKKFQKYAKQVVSNAKTLAEALKKYGFNLVTGGTDNHLILIDLTNKGIDGWCAAWALEYAGIIGNRNAIPHDTRSAFYPSGLRLGTPAITMRGMKEKEMLKIAGWINEVINAAVELLTKEIENKDKSSAKKARAKFKTNAAKNATIKSVNAEVKKLCSKFRV